MPEDVAEIKVRPRSLRPLSPLSPFSPLSPPAQRPECRTGTGPGTPLPVKAPPVSPRRRWRGQLDDLYQRSQSISRVTGLPSKARLTWLLAVETVLADRHQPAAGTALPVRARSMGGREVWLRPRSRDRAALEFVYQLYHLPPPDLAGQVGHIAVFGANIGLLLGDLAGRYPQARLLGVEPDHDNAALARRNLAHLAGRCSLREAAVWHRDEVLTLGWEYDAWGRILTSQPPSGGMAPGTVRMDAIDAGRLLSDFAGPAPIDYLLVNIESAWYEMLRHGEWTQNVRCLKIEIQDHYDEAVPLLEALGYRAWLQRLSWGAFVTGVRRLAGLGAVRPSAVLAVSPAAGSLCTLRTK